MEAAPQFRASGLVQSLDDLRKIFDDPPREFFPTSIWWWSGERLEIERLRWQLQRLAEGGVYNVVILNLAPVGPLFGKDADGPPFMSEEWWMLFLAICEHAEMLGMRIWFYDQIGFSGANLQGQLCLQDELCRGMVLAQQVLKGEKGTETKFPPAAVPLAAFVTDLDENDQPVGLPRECSIEKDTVQSITQGRHRLRLVYALWGGFDYFEATSCRRLLDRVHGEFERRAGRYLGRVIAGSFQDELPSMPSWGRGFAEAFRQRAGYDLQPYLWALWEGTTEEAQRVRVDYQRIRAELTEEAFFRPFFNWHDQRGMICGFDQQGNSRRGYPLDTVNQYADYLRTHRWYGAPGCDHHGEARIHSSLAKHYDRRRVWIEAFHSTGWGGTLEETFDWLLPWWLAGANLYNPHAVYYSTRGGWWEWAPPSTCWRQPYWRHYRLFATAVARNCALLAQGTHTCEVAVLHPTTTVQAFLTQDGPLPQARAADATYRTLLGEMVWFEPRPGALDKERLDFSILDDATVQRGEAREGRLVLGAASYSTILLPACVVLEEATAHQLASFVESGGRLIAVDVTPSAQALHAYFELHPAVSVQDLPKLLRSVPRVVTGPTPLRHSRVGDVNLAFVSRANPQATEMNPVPEWWFLTTYSFDSRRYQRPLSLVIHESPVTVEVWDPVTGRRFAPPTEPTPDGTKVHLPGDSSPGVFLVWSRGVSLLAEIAPRWTQEQELSHAWQFELEPTIENRFGDLSWPAPTDALPVQTWRFKHREGEADSAAWPERSYEIVHATFGPQGWFRGPVAADDARTLRQGDGWRPAIYSLSRGIWKDHLHTQTLGPSGHVPEEFLDFDFMKEGQAAQFCTSVWRDTPSRLYLAIGAPGRKGARVNGMSLEQLARGYLWMEPIELKSGWNQIEWHFWADVDCRGRCYWALITNHAAFRRPEFMTSADAPLRGSQLVFSRGFELPFEAISGQILIHASAACRIVLDGQEIGRQGGFLPYGDDSATIIWRSAALKRGPHRIELYVVDGAEPARLLVDAEWRGQDGSSWDLISDASWAVSRDGHEPRPTGLRLDAMGPWLRENASLQLRRRPHPLPRAHWLEQAAADGTVLDLSPDFQEGKSRIESFQWTLPPGAHTMKLPVAGTCTLWIDGEIVNASAPTIRLPRSHQPRRLATLRVETVRGSSGGGLFLAPIEYEMSPGEIELGDWSEQGLESYSGGIRYRKEFTLDEVKGGRWALDLGRVRGTAEVWINGQHAGIRFLSPYRFEATSFLRSGQNAVEILVLNTLAPYLAEHSPTQLLPGVQTVSGLFGPVRILSAE